MVATNYTTPPELIIAASYNNSWSVFLVFCLIAGGLFSTGLRVESRYEGLGQCLAVVGAYFFALRKRIMLVLLHTGVQLSLPTFPQYFIIILPQLLPDTCSETQDLLVRYKWPCERDAIVNSILHLLGQDHSLRPVPSGAGKQTFDDLVFPAFLMIYFGCLQPFYRAYIHMRLVLWWYGEEEIVNCLVQMAEDSRKRKEDKLQEEGRMPLGGRLKAVWTHSGRQKSRLIASQQWTPRAADGIECADNKEPTSVQGINSQSVGRQVNAEQ